MAPGILTALDHAKTQYYHFKAIIIAGMGLFTDAYDLFCIVPVMKIIGRIYYESIDGNPGVIPPGVFSATVAIALVGTVIGQLVFGYLGDRMGRRRVYGLSLLLIVLGSLGSGFSICRTKNCVLTSLCFFRFILGVGIGGDYPLSATIMSEFANTRTRGAFIAAVFSMQGFGILASSAVTMVVAKCFERATRVSENRPLHTDRGGLTPFYALAPSNPLHTPEGADVAWRIILMMGAVPAALTCYWRMSMPETPRFTALVELDVIKATTDMNSLDLHTIHEDTDDLRVAQNPPPPTYSLFSHEFFSRHGRHLFACAFAWLLVDIPFYSSTLFQSQIYKPWFKEAKNAYEEAYNVAKFQAIIAAASTIPGYWATVYFIDSVGRRKIQMMGFFFMAVFLFAMAGPYDGYWHDHINGWFMVLYGLTFFFSNFGPNTTTFIVPAELFPARFRTTCYGISGAAGKVGAIIGAVGFQWASQDRDKTKLDRGWEPGIGMMYAIISVGGICVIGLVHTFVFTPETKGISLEINEGGEAEPKENGENNAEDFQRSTSDTLRHHFPIERV